MEPLDVRGILAKTDFGKCIIAHVDENGIDSKSRKIFLDILLNAYPSYNISSASMEQLACGIVTSFPLLSDAWGGSVVWFNPHTREGFIPDRLRSMRRKLLL